MIALVDRQRGNGIERTNCNKNVIMGIIIIIFISDNFSIFARIKKAANTFCTVTYNKTTQNFDRQNMRFLSPTFLS